MNAELRQKLNAAEEQLNAIIVGKPHVIRQALCCLLARGHILLEDLPGAGKTTLAKAFSVTLGLDYRRIQFTSDLLPADVIGFSLLEDNQLKFHQGPVFTQLLLADEINRASPKSQSALLEAMEERQITVEHNTYKLPEPFFVFATQNPHEQIGTFALPESQLDRFMLRLSMGYPDSKIEVEIFRGITREQMLKQARVLLLQADILTLQNAVTEIHISQAVAEYLQLLLKATRENSDFISGISTRGGLALLRAAQALALIENKPAVLPHHIQDLFPAAAWHRLRSRSQENHAHNLKKIVDSVPVPV